MPVRCNRRGKQARIVLGVIRLINGGLGTLARGVPVRRLGSDRAANPAARCAFRFFGARTVLPLKSFEELTDNPEWAEELLQVYDGDINRVALMGGMFAEPKPAGLAFSDTAFRIFVLMAPRRLKGERFFTTDFTPQVHTQVGLDWIADNDMSTVLLRHFPNLRPVLRGVTNAFGS